MSGRFGKVAKQQKRPQKSHKSAPLPKRDHTKKKNANSGLNSFFASVNNNNNNDDDEEILSEEIEDAEKDTMGHMFEANQGGVENSLKKKRKIEGESSDEDEEDEEKKREKLSQIRLETAKRLLQQLGAKDEDEDDEEGNMYQQKEELSKLLHHKLKEKHGTAETVFSEELKNVDLKKEHCILRGHGGAVTCAVINSQETWVISGSKDSNLIQWDIKTGKKNWTIKGQGMHSKKKTQDEIINSADGPSGHVLALALTWDDKFVAAGGQDFFIRVFDTSNQDLVHMFRGHRDIVTGLSFRWATHELYSCSYDRTIKVWDIDDGTYIDSLYGHTDVIYGLDALRQERVVAASRDQSVRLFKVPEKTQILFQYHPRNRSARGKTYLPVVSMECVAALDDKNFISGSQVGSLYFWNISKKKPLHIQKNAHKEITTTYHDTLQKIQQEKPTWITALTAMRNSDVVASGSSDGTIRIWKAADSRLEILAEIPVVGFINSLVFSPSGKYLIASVAKEHRLGRWSVIKEARNSVVVIPLKDK